jgi:hypothetical protein
MANEKLTYIGPLPKVSRTHELQALSLEALRAALLPSDRFIIRDERIEDYGVDCSLEAKIAPPRGSQVASPIAEEKGPKTTAWATNLRAQAQVKGTESLELRCGKVDIGTLEHRSSIAPSPLAGEGWDGGERQGRTP